MKKYLVALLTMALVATSFAGCGSSDETHEISKDSSSDTSTSAAAEAEEADSTASEASSANVYYFTYDGADLTPNMPMADAIAAIGEGSSYYEAASCAFEGEMDKTYGYGSFQIVTYPTDGEDWISYIQLLDDTISTPEGVTIGDSADEVIAAYGEDYTESGSMMVYEADDMQLCFLISGGEVSSIQYLTTLIDL